MFSCDVILRVCGAVRAVQLSSALALAPGTRSIFRSTRRNLVSVWLAGKRNREPEKHGSVTSIRSPGLPWVNSCARSSNAAAAIDISDGLSLDLHRVCLASSVAADIVVPPRFPGASADQALHGGEEYELLFFVRSGARVPAEFEGLKTYAHWYCPFWPPGEVRLQGKPLTPGGFDHFASSRADV